jgi:hypothetical protein
MIPYVRPLLLGTVLALTAGGAQAHRMDCGQLRSQIEAKLHARGVQGFSLDIVEAGDTGSARVVGTCDQGSHRIVYARGGGRPTPPEPPSSASAKSKKKGTPRQKARKPAPVPPIGNY